MKIFGILTKSDAAIRAENAGRYVASEIGRQLGIPAAAVAALAPHNGEWHHVGKYANEVCYYDLAECEEYFLSDAGEAALKNWKEQRKAAKAKLVIFTGVSITWREFTGSFRRPTCHEYKEENAAIIWTGGAFVEVARPNGSVMRKKIDGNHIEIPFEVRKELK